MSENRIPVVISDPKTSAANSQKSRFDFMATDLFRQTDAVFFQPAVKRLPA